MPAVHLHLECALRVDFFNKKYTSHCIKSLIIVGIKIAIVLLIVLTKLSKNYAENEVNSGGQRHGGHACGRRIAENCARYL